MAIEFGSDTISPLRMRFVDKNKGDWARGLHIHFLSVDDPAFAQDVKYNSASRSNYKRAGDKDTFKILETKFLSVLKNKEASDVFKIKAYINYAAHAESAWSSEVDVILGKQDIIITLDSTKFKKASANIEVITAK
jgi:hypothetical protein